MDRLNAVSLNHMHSPYSLARGCNQTKDFDDTLWVAVHILVSKVQEAQDISRTKIVTRTVQVQTQVVAVASELGSPIKTYSIRIPMMDIS